MEPFILWLPLLACCVTLLWCPVVFRLSITAAGPEYSLTGLIQYGNTISSVAVVLLSVDFCRAGLYDDSAVTRPVRQTSLICLDSAHNIYI